MLLSVSGVQYFTNEQHERAEYAKAIANYQRAEYRSMTRWVRAARVRVWAL